LGQPGGVAPWRGDNAGPRCAVNRQVYTEGPYFFPDLADTSEAEEQAAIDAGLIRAGGIRYAATRA
jgi:hypothetical protein